MPIFDIGVRVIVSARSQEEAERIVDSKLIRLESDVIQKTSRFETKKVAD